jgi:large-conductance mechanosensitive channel
MTIFEGPATSAPGLSVFETVVTFVVIPVAMFVVISVLTYAATATKQKSKKTSVLTEIE